MHQRFVSKTLPLWVFTSAMTFAFSVPLTGQDLDLKRVVSGVDAAQRLKNEKILSYTVTEIYKAYRNGNYKEPVATMSVNTVYRKESGKTYTPIPGSASGSSFFRDRVLASILAAEKRASEVGNREGVWVNSSNYDMTFAAPGKELPQKKSAILTLHPRQKTQYLLEGTLWVDPDTFTMQNISGTQAASPNFWAGRCEITREYSDVQHFAMATHVRAVSRRFLFGETVVDIEYKDYQIETLSAH
jgi:hypothetical protein